MMFYKAITNKISEYIQNISYKPCIITFIYAMCLVQMSAHPAQLFKFRFAPKIFLPRSAAGQPIHRRKKINLSGRKGREEKEEFSVGLS